MRTERKLPVDNKIDASQNEANNNETQQEKQQGHRTIKQPMTLKKSIHNRNKRKRQP
jgi:hypothetical protein